MVAQLNHVFQERLPDYLLFYADFPESETYTLKDYNGVIIPKVTASYHGIILLPGNFMLLFKDANTLKQEKV